jgi:hypothetical protein
MKEKSIDRAIVIAKDHPKYNFGHTLTVVSTGKNSVDAIPDGGKAVVTFAPEDVIITWVDGEPSSNVYQS